jgi:hypothetical protein
MAGFDLLSNEAWGGRDIATLIDVIEDHAESIKRAGRG